MNMKIKIKTYLIIPINNENKNQEFKNKEELGVNQ